jgi:hypothetical protein
MLGEYLQNGQIHQKSVSFIPYSTLLSLCRIVFTKVVRECPLLSSPKAA